MSYVRKEEVQAILDEALAENVTIFWHSVIKKRLDRLQTYREQKVGKWILVTNGRGGHECNLCHSYAPSYQNGSEHLSKFCCECGAKMEGADNE